METVQAFKTSDGKVFYDIALAERHEAVLAAGERVRAFLDDALKHELAAPRFVNASFDWLHAYECWRSGCATGEQIKEMRGVE